MKIRYNICVSKGHDNLDSLDSGLIYQQGKIYYFKLFVVVCDG